MGKIQIIDTPEGHKLAVLPLEEFERLVELAEGAEDEAAHARVMERVARGEEEFMPIELVERMLAGESAVKVWREHRGLKVGELANAAGISHAYLSQIESGKREGSISALRRIADALKVAVDDLVPPPAA